MKMKTENQTLHECDRKADLIAYLYQEDAPAERASFERHLNDCDSCRDEIGAFRSVRDDLNTWQVDAVPRTEIALAKRRPNSWLNSWRELITMFPSWARGAALAGAAASLLIFALSFAVPRLGPGLPPGGDPGQTAMTQAQIQSLINEAVARERRELEQKLQEDYRAQISTLKTQLKAEHETRLEAVKAGLKAEIKKSNRTGPSIRSFFAMGESQDPWGEIK